jgi:hypothetical protein
MDHVAADSLMQEVAVLRAQVRNLEEMRRQYEGDEELGDEPPPEYDDSENEDEGEGRDATAASPGQTTHNIQHPASPPQ